MTRLLLIATFMFTLIGAGDGPKNAAIVKLVRGKAILQMGEDTVPITKGMWIREGGMVKTEARSIVRLGFIDKSTMNVGPNSKMKIEKFNKDEAGVINVLSGKIRSQVSKNYLNMDKDKSKMFVKSKAAVMGIRGTDFIFSTHPKTGATTAVLFEGSVVFNNISKNNAGRDLESIVNQGRKIKPGQFSISRGPKGKPTVPAKLSTTQFKALEKNKDFVADAKSKSKAKKKRSAVPPGLTGEAVSSSSDGIGESLAQVAKVDVKRAPSSQDGPSEQTKGFVDGADVKPVDGSIVHIDSGAIIPLGTDSKFDPNTQEWVSSSFEVDKNGQIVTPDGYAMTDDGKLLKKEGGQVRQVDLDIKPLDQTKPLDQIPTKPVETSKLDLGGDSADGAAGAESAEAEQKDEAGDKDGGDGVAPDEGSPEVADVPQDITPTEPVLERLPPRPGSTRPDGISNVNKTETIPDGTTGRLPSAAVKVNVRKK